MIEIVSGYDYENDIFVRRAYTVKFLFFEHSAVAA